jgi:hypothetical protein
MVIAAVPTDGLSRYQISERVRPRESLTTARVKLWPLRTTEAISRSELVAERVAETNTSFSLVLLTETPPKDEAAVPV